MGILLRGPVERFNPQIHTEANSLTTLMQKSMAVKKRSLDLFARYTRFKSFMMHSGRNNKGVQAGRVKSEGIKDNAFRIAYDGALLLPAYSANSATIGAWFAPGDMSPDMSAVVGVDYVGGVTASTVATNTPGTIAVKHEPDNDIWGDKFNPNDSITLGAGGINFLIQQHPRRSSDGSTYLLDGKFIGNAGLFKEEHLAEDEVLTEGGNFFGEGSLRGWQRTTRNKWRINYTSIRRSTVTMTGSAKVQKVCTIINSENGSRAWEWDEVLKNDRIYHIMEEQSLRYSRITMDASSHSWYENAGTNQLTLDGFRAESGLAAPIIGDGWLPQIEDNFRFDYDVNTGISHTQLEDVITVLCQRSPSGTSGNTILGVTDMLGAKVIDRAFKKLLGYGNNAVSADSGTISGAVENITSKKDTELGFEVTKYYYMGNHFVLIQDELFNNPGLYNTNGGVTGTGNIYLLNITTLDDGVSNFEIIHRATRDMRKKMENGMHSFDDSMDNSNVASSGFDGCSIHTLGESMAVLYDVRSCGIIKSTTKYNGGTLSGNSFVSGSNQAMNFMF